jgi:hypothetical protein
MLSILYTLVSLFAYHPMQVCIIAISMHTFSFGICGGLKGIDHTVGP